MAKGTTLSGARRLIELLDLMTQSDWIYEQEIYATIYNMSERDATHSDAVVKQFNRDRKDLETLYPESRFEKKERRSAGVTKRQWRFRCNRVSFSISYDDTEKAVALLSGLDVVAQLAPEMKDACSATKNMISKNLDVDLLEEASAMTNTLSLAIPRRNYTASQEKLKMFQTILRAINEHQSLALSYQSPHYDRHVASLVVMPWRLSFDNGDWTLWAGDALPNHEGIRRGRKLRLTRITALKAHNASWHAAEPWVLSAFEKGHSFPNLNQDTYNKELESKKGGFENYVVKLRFFDEWIERISRTPLFPEAKLQISRNKDFLDFSVQIPSLYDIIPLVLQAAGSVQILSPEELRDEATTRAEALLQDCLPVEEL